MRHGRPVAALTDFDAAAAGQAKPLRLAPAEDFAAWVEAHAPEMKDLAKANGFSGQAGRVLAGPSSALVGVGDGWDPLAAGAVSERLPEGDYRLADVSDPQAESMAALGFALGAYRFDRYRGQSAAPTLVLPERADAARLRRFAGAAWLARDLINTPAGDMTPDALERAVRDLAETYGAEVETTVGDALLSDNFPIIHAVGRAADVAPRLVDLAWGEPDAPKLTLVGKGVTFDSGGLDLKNAAGMALMKKDMGGAANAIALAAMIMDAGWPVRLRLLIPAVENAVSAGAFRPGDILKSRKGLTVEIGNTDAEGRLILADALAYAGEAQPDVTVTLATLTGAARVALGPEVAPVYCADDAFAGAVTAAGLRVGDPCWRMPLWRGYDDWLSSEIADINNAPSGGFAGSITAALFLQRFAPETGLWAHFDIYGWNAKPRPGRPVGGEACAIRALYEALAARFDATQA